MAKARSRAQARKVKDRWKAKKWFNILAPASFDNVTIAQTLTSNPDLLIGRITEITMQDLTNDFRKSHLLLYFKIHDTKDDNAHTHFVGHSLTSDYLRRMIRRRRSKVEGVYDVKTRDGAKLRVKPFATTDKRIQNSQKRVVRESMKKTIIQKAKSSTLSEFIKSIMDGKLGSDIYKNCKKLYPVKRVEIFKTEVNSQPTTEIKDEPKKPEEKPKEEKKEEPKDKPEQETKKEEKPKKATKKKEKTKEEKEESDEPKETEETEEPEGSDKKEETEEVEEVKSEEELEEEPKEKPKDEPEKQEKEEEPEEIKKEEKPKKKSTKKKQKVEEKEESDEE